MAIHTHQNTLLWASFLKYEGNSAAGSDCDRTNDYQIPLAVIQHAASSGANLGFSVETGQVLSFGREVKVGGTTENWDKAWLQTADEISKKMVPNPEVVGVSKQGDRYYLMSLHRGIECEIFKFPAQPLINIVKNGFVPIHLKGRNFFASTDELVY